MTREQILQRLEHLRQRRMDVSPSLKTKLTDEMDLLLDQLREVADVDDDVHRGA